jgi:hypothetical protein
MKIAAMADVHCRLDGRDEVRRLLEGVAEEARAVVLAGDLTDTGRPAEMEILLSAIAEIPLPFVAVLGNHDHETDHHDRLMEMMEDAGVTVLDASVHEIEDVGFVGTKGFCGGFEERIVQPFGEDALKQFIQTGIDEAIRLESAAAKLDECRAIVGVLHYAPIRDTLAGEPPELYPLLGTSRLANALDRRGVRVIVHGHAHHGALVGTTAHGTPVHNVSRFVRERAGEKPYLVLEV